MIHRPTEGSGVPTDPPNQGSSGVRFLGELRRLDVKPGDRFVLMIDDPISSEIANHLRRTWAEFMGGDGSDLLILCSGMKIGIIGEDSE